MLVMARKFSLPPWTTKLPMKMNRAKSRTKYVSLSFADPPELTLAGEMCSMAHNESLLGFPERQMLASTAWLCRSHWLRRRILLRSCLEQTECSSECFERATQATTIDSRPGSGDRSDSNEENGHRDRCRSASSASERCQTHSEQVRCLR